MYRFFWINTLIAIAIVVAVPNVSSASSECVLFMSNELSLYDHEVKSKVDSYPAYQVFVDKYGKSVQFYVNYRLSPSRRNLYLLPVFVEDIYKDGADVVADLDRLGYGQFKTLNSNRHRDIYSEQKEKMERRINEPRSIIKNFEVGVYFVGLSYIISNPRYIGEWFWPEFHEVAMGASMTFLGGVIIYDVAMKGIHTLAKRFWNAKDAKQKDYHITKDSFGEFIRDISDIDESKAIIVLIEKGVMDERELRRTLNEFGFIKRSANVLLSGGK